jgi:CRP-like cAMP-binding protein
VLAIDQPRRLNNAADRWRGGRYFLEAGEVQVVKATNGGLSQIVVAELSKGNFFGEMALVLREARTAGIVATTFCDVQVLTVAGGGVVGLIRTRSSAG